MMFRIHLLPAKEDFFFCLLTDGFHLALVKSNFNFIKDLSGRFSLFLIESTHKFSTLPKAVSLIFNLSKLQSFKPLRVF